MRVRSRRKLLLLVQLLLGDLVLELLRVLLLPVGLPLLESVLVDALVEEHALLAFLGVNLRNLPAAHGAMTLRELPPLGWRLLMLMAILRWRRRW